ncbi:MAG: two-component system response regulator MprA, partial [Ilumatobacter sp.]
MSTILIAEDDKQIREALDRILRFEGYATILVNDGAAALEAFVEKDPDAAIVDVNMPFVDGLSVVRRLRDKGDRTPVLILTA